MYDVIVIGGGVVGCAILRKLSHTNVKCLLIERDEDVSCGSSRANSGIVHAGYDAETGSLKALFNVAGSKMYFNMCKELNVPCQQIGSFVLAREGGLKGLEELLSRGQANGVEGLQILDRQEILKKEPNIADDIVNALYAPTAGVVSPYELTVALAEQAVLNGCEIKLNSAVTSVEKSANGFVVTTNDGKYEAKVVINAAGFGGAEINNMVNTVKYNMSYKKGEYFILDSSERRNFLQTCFPLPDANGKGILVSPTADGNIIVGPTSNSAVDGDDKSVTLAGLDVIKQQTSKMMKNLFFNKTIRVFTGVRASIGEDFVIENVPSVKGFINCIGINSPGLTAAPAIAEYVVNDLLEKAGIKPEFKENYIVKQADPVTRTMSKKDWSELIAKDSSYGRMVCRCEKITEGEILTALNSPVAPTTLDALKRRVRTGMGRCQGGFCSPRIMEILSKHFNIPIEQVTKCGHGSEIVIGNIKEVPNA